jgi:hypothetical protein
MWLFGFQQVKAPRLDSRHYEGGKVVILTHRPFLPPVISWYSFLEAESTPGHLIPSIASGKIDLETLRLVAQCLNHYATPGPLYLRSSVHKTTV